MAYLNKQFIHFLYYCHYRFKATFFLLFLYLLDFKTCMHTIVKKCKHFSYTDALNALLKMSKVQIKLFKLRNIFS